MNDKYDREAARAYALRWAYGRNPRYADFSDMGGDCTNFVSQCLFAGGLSMNYTPVLGWYYRSLNNRAPAWTGVEYLYQFLTRGNSRPGPGAYVCAPEELMPGDLAQLSFDGKTFSHSLFVSDVTPSGIFICTHTYDARQKNLASYTYTDLRPLHITGGFR
ncbi:MAG: amidase domain-containing protein [Clostridiales bacterium]|jgi:hypothetical protein|nr:amidase domain-containing protein [Clostridiales bacterium]